HQTPTNVLAELRPLRRAGPARLAGPDTPGLLHSATRGGSKTGHQRQPSHPRYPLQKTRLCTPGPPSGGSTITGEAFNESAPLFTGVPENNGLGSEFPRDRGTGIGGV